ncbi:tape measure protein [Corticicoccus populi]|uniref:lysostaphin n=1 Tax=Corticicoccus populi TaxID=1812821 RepID=A0ABW5WTB8_9STAP
MTQSLGKMSIAVGLNLSDLGSSSKVLKQQMRQVNSEMKVNASALKNSSSEADKLGSTLKGLEKKQKVQEALVDSAADAYEKMVEKHGEASDEARTYATRLNEEKAKLNDVKNAIENTKGELDDYTKKTAEAEEQQRQLNEELERQRKIADSPWTKLSQGMETYGNKLVSVGTGMKDFGGLLTKSITLPAIGAVTAIGGITAAFGWKRLVAIDSARAQLQGLGYDAEGVDRISSQVSDAIQGTITTMAEGTSIAAGALAAGVEEGAELEEYIKRVGNAAVGANRPVADMAQIFNRVQGGGRMMTMELNMIEDGMPGFAQAMAKHLGIGLEEFRKMVSEGKVSSEDFMTVMDDFAGGMAEAYAGTWEGMVANTKSNIGIIGQNLLSGVFEQSKESIGQFLELLRSDDLKNWASEAGEKLGTAFTQIVEKVKGAVEWFTKLETETQKLYGIFTLAAVAAGPLITVFGTILIFIGQVMKTLSPLFALIGKAGGLFKILGTAVGLLFTPVGLIVGAIAGLAAGFIIAYNNSDTFRQGVHNVIERVREGWEYIKEFGSGIKDLFTGSEENGMKILSALGVTDDNIQRILGLRDNVMSVKDKIIELKDNIVAQVQPALEGVMSFISDIGTRLKEMWNENASSIIPTVTNIGNIVSTVFNAILTVINFVMPAVSFIIKMVWENIKGVINGGLTFIDGLIKVFTGIFTGDFSKLWEGVKNIFFGGIQFVWNLFQLMFYGRIIKGVGTLVTSFSGLIRSLWTNVVKFFTSMSDSAILRVYYMRDWVVKTIRSLYETVVLRIMYMRDSVVKTVTSMRDRFTDLVRYLYIRVRDIFSTLRARVVDIVTNLRTRVTDLISNLRTRFTEIVTNLFNRVRDTFTRLRDRASDIMLAMRMRIADTISRLRDAVVNRVTNLRDRAVAGFNRLKDRASKMVKDLKDKVSKYFDDMVEGAKALPGKLGDGIKNFAYKAINGAITMGNSMIDKVANVVNKIIDGINSVTSKLGIKDNISHWNPTKISTVGSGGGRARGAAGAATARFSTGTNPNEQFIKNGAIAQNMFGMVGDKGDGNGSGTREIVQYPNGQAGLFDNNTELFLPKGTIIYNNKQTEQILNSMPQFSTGTNAGSGTDIKRPSQTRGAKKSGWGTFKDLLSNTWDYIKNPKKALEAIVANVAPSWGKMSGFALNMAKGGFNTIKDSALNFITKIFKDNEGGEVNGGSILNRAITARFGTYPPAIARQLGVSRHYGLDTAHKYEKLTSPVSGKVTRVWHDKFGGNAIQIKAGDLNWWFMHMQSIARKVGDAVKAGKTNLGVTGNTGLRTTGYHLHSQAMKGGIGNAYAIDPLPLLRKAQKFATGGLVGNGFYHLGEEGYKEFIISTDPKRRADSEKLLALASKTIQKNNGNLRPNQLPNISGGSNNNQTKHEVKELKSMVEELMESNKNQNKMIELLTQLVNKPDMVAVYNENQLARDLQPAMSKRMNITSDRNARFNV